MTLFFEDGDKSKPRILGWQSGALVVTLQDGGAPVARVGDQITITTATSPSGTVSGVGIITAGNPKVLA